MGSKNKKSVPDSVDDFIYGISQRYLGLYRSVQDGSRTVPETQRKLALELRNLRATLSPVEAERLDKAIEFIRANRGTQEGINKIRERFPQYGPGKKRLCPIPKRRGHK